MTDNSCWAAKVAELRDAQLEWLRGIDPELPEQLLVAHFDDVITVDELR